MSKVYRTEKNDNYTVMCNHHLKNKELSLKAKGLLSQMLSFPDGWNFNLKGLATLNKDGVDSMRATMNELERAGYVTRNRNRNEKGQLLGTEYTVREIPQIRPEPEKSVLEQPVSEKPILDSPVLGNPIQENPTLLNTKKSSMEQINTNLLNIHRSIPGSKADAMDENDRDLIKSIFKKNIDYETLSYDYNQEVVDEILELMVDTYCSTGKTIRINKNEVPVNVVKGQLMKLDMFHIQYVMQCMKNNTTKIGNIHSYLLTALYNAPFTKNNFYQAEVNHALYSAEPEQTTENDDYDPEDYLQVPE